MDLKLISKIDNNLLNNVKINNYSILGFAANQSLLSETKQILNLLIDKGAVFCKEDGLCFFVHDLLREDDEFLTKLIKAGLNVGDFGCEGRGFTYEIIKEGRNNIILTLLNNRECLTNTYNGAILLANVILYANYDLAHTIIKMIDVKKCYDDLLEVYAKCYDKKFYNAFLKGGNSFTKKVDYDINPICAAIYMERPDILEELLDLGVTHKHHSDEETLWSDVFYYSKKRDVSLKFIKILVSHGVEICDWKFACYNFLPECINLLVELGLDKDKLDWKKEDIAPLSKKEGNLISIIKVWFHHIKKVDRENRVQDLAHTIKFLLDINADVNFVNDDGDNSITYLLNNNADPENYFETFEILINAGLNLDHKNKEGNSARSLIEEKYKASKKIMNLIRKI